MDRLSSPFVPTSSLPSGILISRRFRFNRNSHSPRRAQHAFDSSQSWTASLVSVAEHLVTHGTPAQSYVGPGQADDPIQGGSAQHLNQTAMVHRSLDASNNTFRQSIEFWCATLLLPFWNYFNSILPSLRATRLRMQTLVNCVDTNWCYFGTAGRHLPSLCMSLRGHDTLVHSASAGTLDL